jgi:predicted nucleotidyltransferase component of viral defense system
MRLPKTSDAAHKVNMYRLLSAILNDNWLSQQLVFKGGTCAALRGWLNRFSIDLDFDLPDKTMKPEVRTRIIEIVDSLRFEIKDQSHDHLQFFLKYSSPPMMRNTLKLEINDTPSPLNESEPANLAELNRIAITQTQSTMVANKMVAALGRLENTGSVAGRDFYDLHHFLSQGYEIKKDIVEERTKRAYGDYVTSLIDYVEHTLTETKLYEDINPLLPANEIQKVVKNLREELLWLLRGLLHRARE